MRNSNNCGSAVGGMSTTKQLWQRLYTLIQRTQDTHGHKRSSYTPNHTQVSTIQNHSSIANPTTVNSQVIPTIHTTYKDYKKFLTKNTLLIYTGAV
jgi:hypothetical protein